MIVRLHFLLSLVISYVIYFNLINLDKLSSIILAIITAKLSTIPDFDYKIFFWANKQIIFLKKTKVYMFLLPYYLFLIFLVKLFKHRGITHSVYPIILFILLTFLISNIFFVLALAFFLHMIEDSVTVSGIQPFYPLSNFKITIPILNNRNRVIQNIICFILLILFFIILIK